MTKSKKDLQLGMNASTASGRLVKDILWKYIVLNGDYYCCKCGFEMGRETFSIEHLTPWLDSENPLELFFDLNNISFSHLKCNAGDARKPNKKYFTEEEKRVRAAENQRNLWNKLTPEQKKASRRNKYLKYGV